MWSTPVKLAMVFCIMLVFMQGASGFNASSLDVINFNLDPREMSESSRTLTVTVAIKDPMSSPGNLQNVTELHAIFTGPWHDRNKNVILRAHGGNRANGIYKGTQEFTKEDIGISNLQYTGIGSNGIWSLDRLLALYDNGDVKDLSVPEKSVVSFRVPWSWFTRCLIFISGVVFLIFAYLILLYEFIKKKQRAKKEQVRNKADNIKDMGDRIIGIADRVDKIALQVKINVDKTIPGSVINKKEVVGTGATQKTEMVDDINELIKEARDQATAARNEVLSAKASALDVINLAVDIKEKLKEDTGNTQKDKWNLTNLLKNIKSGFCNMVSYPIRYREELRNVIQEIYKIDGTPSASRAQFVIWTAVAAYSYIAITADKAIIHGYFDFNTEFPLNLILAMGLSAGTALVSQSISTQKDDASVDSRGGILLDDTGNFDLGKIQMMAWTVIAAGGYLILVYHNIFSGFDIPGLPDIDPSLLALMGIGDTTYLLKKKIDNKPPEIISLDKTQGNIDEAIGINGNNFGTGGKIWINTNGESIVRDLTWSDRRITLKLPQGQESGELKIAIEVAGKKSNEKEYKLQ